MYKFKASIFSTIESLEEKNEMAVLMISKAIHVTHSSSVYERPAPCYTENREREPTSNPTPTTYRVHPYSSVFYVCCPCTIYIPSQELLYLIPLLLGYRTPTLSSIEGGKSTSFKSSTLIKSCLKQSTSCLAQMCQYASSN